MKSTKLIGAKEDLSEKIPEKTGSNLRTIGHSSALETKSAVVQNEKNENPLKIDLGIKENASQ